MIGKISKAPGPGGTPGLLTADNGRSYTFTSAGWIASSVVPAVGMGVEFDLRGSHAVNVRPTGPFRRPLSGSGSAAGLVPRQDNPPPGSQLKPRRTANPKQQINRSRGSMLAAMRPMISIFMVTPLTIPLVLLLPIIGRLEIISTVLLAGFLGGRRAGGFGKALAAAILVSSAHGVVVYLMVLVGLQLMVDLPHAGGYFDSGIGFVGGIKVASSIGAILVAVPVFLVLVASSAMGALTAKI